MKTKLLGLLTAAAAIAAIIGNSPAGITDGMEKGSPALQSAGALAFGPEGVLFAADAKGAAVYAIATGDVDAKAKGSLSVKGINQKIAALLGTGADEIIIEDLAVNTASGAAYLSVSRGRGPEAQAALVRVAPGGKLELVKLDGVMFSKLELSDAPEDRIVGEGRRKMNRRLESITDLAYLDGKVAIAGLSNEEFASTLRIVPFPFTGKVAASSLEIYHGAHGKLETHSPIRTFLPMAIDGEPNIVASYTCTPLVRIPVKDLKPKGHVVGTTVAELGNRNRPLDMIDYSQDGKQFILMANSARGVMKVAADGIGSADAITEPVGGGGTKGLPYETIEAMSGIVQLDRLGADEAVVVQESDGGSDLVQLALP